MSNRPIPCEKCRGDGEYFVRQLGRPETEMRTCEPCGGTGRQ